MRYANAKSLLKDFLDQVDGEFVEDFNQNRWWIEDKYKVKITSPGIIPTAARDHDGFVSNQELLSIADKIRKSNKLGKPTFAAKPTKKALEESEGYIK